MRDAARGNVLVKAIPPCVQFVVESESCACGYTPRKHCSICQLYESDWDAYPTKLAKWSQVLGLDFSARPAIKEPMAIRVNRLNAKRRTPREADEQ